MYDIQIQLNQMIISNKRTFIWYIKHSSQTLGDEGSSSFEPLIQGMEK